MVILCAGQSQTNIIGLACRYCESSGNLLVDCLSIGLLNWHLGLVVAFIFVGTVAEWGEEQFWRKCPHHSPSSLERCGQPKLSAVVLKQETWINYQAPNWSLNLVNLHLEQVYNRPVLVRSVCGMVGQFIFL